MTRLRSPERLPALGLALIVLSFVVGLTVAGTDGPVGVETQLFGDHYSGVDAQAEQERQSDAVRAIGSALIIFGDPRFFVPAVVLMGAVAWRRGGRGDLIRCIGGPVAVALLIQFVAKPGFDRIFPSGGLSYPSGHSGAAIALALTALFLLRALGLTMRWGALLLLAPLATGMGMVLLHYHYPLDVLGGWSLGAGVVLLMWGIGRSGRPVTASAAEK